jgi:molybdenum cofactor cytidylyltransferase
MLAALILAAGASSRMGSPKALLHDRDGRTFVARLVRAFASAGIVDIVVVSGDSHEAVVGALDAERSSLVVRVERNADPGRGQLSSLWVGLDALDRSTEGVLVTPVDVPLITAATIASVADVWRNTRAPVVRPAVGERHGHPVLFDRAVFDELRRAPLNRGAKTVVHAHVADLINVPVDDAGCLADVDTRDDYERLIRGTGRPS